MKDKILITAANGNTGFPAAKELIRLGFSVRAFVRNPNNPKALELRKMGAEIFTGNIEDIRHVRTALQGVESAYFIPTYPNVLFQGITFLTAVEEMGTSNVVLLTQWLSTNNHHSRYTKEHWLLDRAFKRLENTKVVILNPGLFAFVYFMMPEPMLQLGVMPDFGTNAPPSNEDIGLVAAHILKNPDPHQGQTYRVTGRDLLTAQQMADMVEKVIGRKIKAQKLPENMMLKMFRSYGFPKIDSSQVRYFIKDAQEGAFAINAPTSVVKDIVGKEADSFEIISRRYLEGNPMSRQSIGNKLKTLGIMTKAMITPLWDMKKFEKESGFPSFKNMMLSVESEEWRNLHKSQNTHLKLKTTNANQGA